MFWEVITQQFLHTGKLAQVKHSQCSDRIGMITFSIKTQLQDFAASMEALNKNMERLTPSCRISRSMESSQEPLRVYFKV